MHRADRKEIEENNYLKKSIIEINPELKEILKLTEPTSLIYRQKGNIIKMKTRKYIKEMKENFVRVSEEQEKALLRYWGEEIPEELTGQDICEQVNKVMNNYDK